LSAAIAAGLALGTPLVEAVGAAKQYITGAIRQAHLWEVPGGTGAIRALNHFPEGVGCDA
ncbi:MAG: bifunctional hydroxymethylpyrimidine kinase/phosphomethylpyrimidine kinase, partial [Verrucomicrobiae bacterium]|nr:bifunctional hydroxymethylpyrimidine kinase/phosphomethylpyrimidine kinase [Verrucomicrobiae bacterium]